MGVKTEDLKGLRRLLRSISTGAKDDGSAAADGFLAQIPSCVERREGSNLILIAGPYHAVSRVGIYKRVGRLECGADCLIRHSRIARDGVEKFE